MIDPHIHNKEEGRSVENVPIIVDPIMIIGHLPVAEKGLFHAKDPLDVVILENGQTAAQKGEMIQEIAVILLKGIMTDRIQIDLILLNVQILEIDIVHKNPTIKKRFAALATNQVIIMQIASNSEKSCFLESLT